MGVDPSYHPGSFPRVGATDGVMFGQPVRPSLIVLSATRKRICPRVSKASARSAARSTWSTPGSTDRTVEIARATGAVILEHPFESHTKQWGWALANVPGEVEWVLGLDADLS